MTRTGSRWLLLIVGASFWITLAVAGPIFGRVAGISDLRPTLFLVFGLPIWVLAASSATRRDTLVGSIGGVVLAALCTTFNVPLHVRALYWQDACEAKDVDACHSAATYYRHGYSWIGGLQDAERLERLAEKWSNRGRVVKAKKPVRISSQDLAKRCGYSDFAACSEIVDRGFYPHQRVACEQIVNECTHRACFGDRNRCHVILESFYELDINP